VTAKTEHQVAKGRVASIDALRGFDMFWIIGGACSNMADTVLDVSQEVLYQDLSPLVLR